MMGKIGMRPGAGLRRTRMRLFEICALLLIFAMALPAHGADERAVKTRVAPTYPEIAKRLRIAGIVKVEATVDPDGKVLDVKTISGNRMLSEAAEDAVRKWKFEAGDGKATVDININFTASE